MLVAVLPLFAALTPPGEVAGFVNLGAVACDAAVDMCCDCACTVVGPASLCTALGYTGDDASVDAAPTTSGRRLQDSCAPAPGLNILDMDLNNDSCITMRDLMALTELVGTAANESGTGDFDGDGHITTCDTYIMVNQTYYGHCCALTAPLSALDLDGDGCVTTSDFMDHNQLIGSAGEAVTGDYNSDGQVDVCDQSLLLDNLGCHGAAPPPPACVASSGLALEDVDLNDDGCVNINDLMDLQALIGQAAPASGHADLNGDGAIDTCDLSILMSGEFWGVGVCCSMTQGAVTDLNSDGCTDVQDFLDLQQLYGLAAEGDGADLNGDGQVDQCDADLLLASLGDGCAAPASAPNRRNPSTSPHCGRCTSSAGVVAKYRRMTDSELASAQESYSEPSFDFSSHTATVSATTQTFVHTFRDDMGGLAGRSAAAPNTSIAHYLFDRVPNKYAMQDILGTLVRRRPSLAAASADARQYRAALFRMLQDDFARSRVLLPTEAMGKLPVPVDAIRDFQILLDRHSEVSCEEGEASEEATGLYAPLTHVRDTLRVCKTHDGAKCWVNVTRTSRSSFRLDCHSSSAITSSRHALDDSALCCGNDVAFGSAVVLGEQRSSATGDPHIEFAYGGRADFHGANNTFFVILSAEGVHFAARTNDVTHLLPRPQLVYGSFFTATSFVLEDRDSNVFEVRSAADRIRFDVAGSSLNGGALSRVGRWVTWSSPAGGVVVSQRHDTLVVTSWKGWQMNATRKPIYNYVGGGFHTRFDISISPTIAASSSRVHGILGQSWHRRTVMHGREDDYTYNSSFPVVYTRANAEGALEGSYKDYISGADGRNTSFRFSCFRAPS